MYAEFLVNEKDTAGEAIKKKVTTGLPRPILTVTYSSTILGI